MDNNLKQVAEKANKVAERLRPPAFRDRLAGWTIVLSVLGITAISATAILVASGTTREETTRLVFGAVLPLLGTWVGTVLAFYFARENFEAATESTQNLVKLSNQLTRETPVLEGMIKLSDITARVLTANETEADVTMGQMLTSMRGQRFRRMPILTPEGTAKYVVHDSLIQSFAEDQKIAVTDAAFLDRSLRDLLDKDDLKRSAEAIAFVAALATVGDARESLKEVPGSNDVFVTVNGAKDEPILGWFTNTLLASAD
jgi:hypothetical protein